MNKKIMLVLAAISLCVPVFADNNINSTTPVVRSIKIQILAGKPERREKLEKMALKMIRCKQGKPFSDTALLASIELLKQTSQFSQIDVPDQNWDAAFIDIVFRLTPTTLIRDIKVKGSFPVFKEDVINVTDYTVGNSFNKNSLEKNIKSIEALYKKNGYIDPIVKINPEQTGELELAILISVEKKEFLKINKIEFHGNKNFADTRLKMKMKSYELPIFLWSKGERSIQEDIEKDMKKLLTFYRKKGFAEVVIKHHLERNDQAATIGIIINIDEGPRYRITFSGNHQFLTYTLKKDLILSTKGNSNDFELKKSLRNIKKRYEQAGYKDCRVNFTAKNIEEAGSRIRDIHIIIEENTRYLVRSSIIKGSESINEKELKKELLTLEKAFLYDGPFVDNKFHDDTKAVESYYINQGFVDTKVTGNIFWDKKNEAGIVYGDVIFSVNEGYQKTITKVSFQGLPDQFEKDLGQIIEIRPGKPFVKSLVQKDRMAILSYLAEKGYIYAKVEAHVKPETEKETCSIEFHIDKNTHVTAAGVWTFGNFRTKDSVLLRHNIITDDESVSLNKFFELQKNIRNINSIEKAEFKLLGIKENYDQVFFIADVEEKKPYFLEASLGYDTARDTYFSVSLGDKNFMGMNRELFLGAEISGIGYETILGIKDFDFLSQYILTQLSVYASQEELKNQGFGSRKYGSELSFEKEFFRYLKLGTSFNLESREQYPVSTSKGVDSEIYVTRGIATITPFLTWSTVDSFIKPTEGFYFNASAGYNKDVLENLDNFIKYRAKAKYYFQAFPKLVLAFQGMYGFIQNIGTDSRLPDDQLFFLGGISDVRGFGENELFIDSLGDPAGGKTQIAGTIEARIDLGMNFELPVFLDAGSLKDTGIEGINEKFKFTVGTGIRYMTPLGPVGLLYGYKLNPDDNEDSGQFHFSIGYTF
ncbi:MAG: BamA/TamA family outer membrane protein [Deltaproteobacteria bacterium]|uniref:POTRA domain-containing protein n=1 Tax=Desulfobacula sp. TaxID=2593537 RepID=UPI00199F4B8F|nr:BamA/TamA family outer membrane protein [Candidatus Desulfobacula maris]MBL6993083.1 BamA/TamA family outer membrane protein [Desulfobacula sp.]